jgi:hypothetical protein
MIMMLIRNIVLLLILALAFTSCIKRINVKTRAEKPILVVDGSITTDSIPYRVRLTYSGPFTSTRDITDELLEKDAIVSIEDNEGNTTALSYKDSGIYVSSDPSYIGKVGRSYHVNILLKDGTRFVSRPETIKPVHPISGVKVNFVMDFDIELPTYMSVGIDANDPSTEENYYQWKFYSLIMRQTFGVPCGFQCIRFEYCYQAQFDNGTHLLSDQYINGNEIKNQTVGRIYIYTYGNPYIEVAQHSISREAYQFWSRYKEQLERTGGTLDPLPASIKGNVYNAKDDADFALGYFSASSVFRKKVIVIPQGITEYLLDISARSHIPPGPNSCFEYYPNALPYPDGRYPPPPPGWENAEIIKVYW